MSRGSGWICVFFLAALGAAGCVSSTDFATLEADVNDARRIAFENRADLRDLKDRIGGVGTEGSQADLTDIAEAFKNIRESQAGLYQRLEDLERSFQETTGQTEETTFQNAQNMRVLMERVDALTAQMQALHVRITGHQGTLYARTGVSGPSPEISPTHGAPGGQPGVPTGEEMAPDEGARGQQPAAGLPPMNTTPPVPDSSGAVFVPGASQDEMTGAPPQASGPGAAVQPDAGTVPGPGTVAPDAASAVASLGMTPVGLYRRGHEFLQEKNFGEARNVFKRFLRDYPDHTYAGNSQYWLAETYYAEGNFEDAILAYEDVIRKHKGSDKVPDAMLKQGYSFLKLMDPRTAKVLLESVLRKYPDSEEAQLARKKLAEIEKGAGTAAP